MIVNEMSDFEMYDSESESSELTHTASSYVATKLAARDASDCKLCDPQDVVRHQRAHESRQRALVTDEPRRVLMQAARDAMSNAQRDLADSMAGRLATRGNIMSYYCARSPAYVASSEWWCRADDMIRVCEDLVTAGEIHAEEHACVFRMHRAYISVMSSLLDLADIDCNATLTHSQRSRIEQHVLLALEHGSVSSYAPALSHKARMTVWRRFKATDAYRAARFVMRWDLFAELLPNTFTKYL